MNSNDEGMKYSPCKNSEAEDKIHQQQAALILTGSGNQNIIVDCAAYRLTGPVLINVAAILQETRFD